MATNQVINGKNRITEFPNRWSLTNVGGNNYDVEQVTGEITEVGTPYSKAILDKIDNVLSYLTPSVEKVELIVPTPVTSNVAYKNISETLNENVVIDSMNVNYEKYSGTNLNPTLKVYGENTNIALYGAATSTNKVGMYVQDSGYTRYTNDYFNYFFNNRTTTNYTLNFRLYSKSQILYMDYDFKGNVSCTYHYYYMNSSDLNIEFYTSNNGTDWTLIGTGSKGTEYTINISNARYFRIKNYNTTVFSMYRSYFTNLTGIVDMIVNQNQFTLDNNTSFTNNQRVLVNTIASSEHGTTNLLPTTFTTDSTNKVHGICTNSGQATFEISTTGSTTGFPISNSIDNDINTFWASSNANDMFNIHFSSPVKINKIEVKAYGNYDGDNYDIKFYSDVQSALAQGRWSTNQVVDIQDCIATQDYYFKTTYNYGKTNIFALKITDWEVDSFTSGVSSNTLNEVGIDTLLQGNKYYELVYNSSHNKFIAQEVRN